DTILLRAAHETALADWTDELTDLVEQLSEEQLDECLRNLNRSLTSPDAKARYERGVQAINEVIESLLESFPEKVAFRLIGKGLKLHESAIAAAIAPELKLGEDFSLPALREVKTKFPQDLLREIDDVIGGNSPITGAAIGRAVAIRTWSDTIVGD